MTQRAGFVPSSDNRGSHRGACPHRRMDAVSRGRHHQNRHYARGVADVRGRVVRRGRASTRNSGCVRLAKSIRPIRGTT